MKRIIAALLALCLALSLCGCVAENREYIPHGGALASEDGELPDDCLHRQDKASHQK